MELEPSNSGLKVGSERLLAGLAVVAGLEKAMAESERVPGRVPGVGRIREWNRFPGAKSVDRVGLEGALGGT